MKFEIEGASLSTAEQERIHAALDALTQDPHAPRAISVTFTLHVHNEYPKVLYKGADTVTVNNEAEEDAQNANGFGDYQGPVAVAAPVVDAPAAATPVPASPALVPPAPVADAAPAASPAASPATQS